MKKGRVPKNINLEDNNKSLRCHYNCPCCKDAGKKHVESIYQLSYILPDIDPTILSVYGDLFVK